MPAAQGWRLSWKSHFRGCIRGCETSTQPSPCTRIPLEGKLVANMRTSRGQAPTTLLKGGIQRLKKAVGKPHPNIYEIIDVFKREEESTKMKMQMLEAVCFATQLCSPSNVCVWSVDTCVYKKLTFRLHHARHSASIFTALWCGCSFVKVAFYLHYTSHLGFG